MESLLVTKYGVPFSAKGAAGVEDSLTLEKEIPDVREGSLVAIGDAAEVVAAAGTGLSDSKNLQFYVGMPDNVAPKRSPQIPLTAVAAAVKQAYVAPSNQVTVLGGDGVADKTSGAFVAGDVGTQFEVTVASTAGDFRAGTTALLKDVSTGLAIAADTDLTEGQIVEVIAAGTPDAWGGATLSSTLDGNLVVGTKVVGATYGVEVFDLEKEVWERRRYNVSLTVNDSSITDAQMLANIVADFNANPAIAEFVTAEVATGDAGIIFTSVDAGHKFQILANGLLYGSTVITDGSGKSQVVDLAINSNDQIKELERLTSGEYGATATRNLDVDIYSVPSQVEAGKTYTTYVFNWFNQREHAYITNNSNPQKQSFVLAVPSDDTDIVAAVDALIAAVA